MTAAIQHGILCRLSCPTCEGTGYHPMTDVDCQTCMGAGTIEERVGADVEALLAKARTPQQLVVRLRQVAASCDQWSEAWRLHRLPHRADLFACEAATFELVAGVLLALIQPPPSPEPTSGVVRLWRRLWRRRAA